MNYGNEVTGGIMGYGYNAGKALSAENACLMENQLRMPGLKENLHAQLQRANAEVGRLTQLISLLDANPDTQRILELMGNKY